MTMSEPRRTLTVLAVLLLIASCVPAVSAETIIDETMIEYEYTGGTVSPIVAYNQFGINYDVKIIRLTSIENHQNLPYIGVTRTYKTGDVFKPNGEYKISYTLFGETHPATMYITNSRNALGSITSSRILVFFDEWEIGSHIGVADIVLSEGMFSAKSGSSTAPENDLISLKAYGSNGLSYPYTITVVSTKEWKNRLIVSSIHNSYEYELIRNLNGQAYASLINLSKGDELVFTDYDVKDIYGLYPTDEIDKITISSSSKNYVYNLEYSAPDDPDDPDTNRTGTVTMTDNNGTTITGFNVTAVNAYTGQEYTVATETAVAVMTLPMDRTIRIRNPQTGEYEDAPVGYYKFYGQSPGYKMLNEDGIKVSVMPEKYRSYQLCDILVTSESGYLTGKHQFQIRSRSDNSVLQTGTISAKSATTGEWYNATVSGGLATIVLPYDTSNSISQYAGNYYVYATSPGYEDSEYATQIVVMPHTVSEIHDIYLTPIGGVPTAGNVTLRIQAFSETGPGVVNAEIFISGVIGEGASVWDTYTASSTGYLTVSVPGNSTYDIVASGDGYYDSARRVEVFMEDPPLIEIKLYLSGAPTVEPTEQPTGWVTEQPTPQPTGGIPDEDDDSEGFLMQAVRGIGLAFGVGFATAKLIFGMLLALSIGYATAKQLRGGAAEFALGLLGGTLLGVLIGLLPVWIIVVLLLVVGLYIGNRYVGGGNNG